MVMQVPLDGGYGRSNGTVAEAIGSLTTQWGNGSDQTSCSKVATLRSANSMKRQGDAGKGTRIVHLSFAQKQWCMHARSPFLKRLDNDSHQEETPNSSAIQFVGLHTAHRPEPD